MNIHRIREYRGAHILILSLHSTFIYVIFYKSKFYTNIFTLQRPGEFTNMEYLKAVDAALIAAKATVDGIRQQRSLTSRIAQYFYGRSTGDIPEEEQRGDGRKEGAEADRVPQPQPGEGAR